MPRDRFLQIYWSLHLCDTSITRQDPRNAKVQPLLDLLCPAFANAYTPGEHIAVDESMVSFKGRVSFKQYMRGKPHPFGIKAFVLADSVTGYLHQVRLYFGKDTALMTDSALLQTTRIVLTLASPLADKGYHLYCDRFYTSPELATALTDIGIKLTGTVQVNRRGMPAAFKTAVRPKPPRGSLQAYRSGAVMALQWQDKRAVTMLSTAHSCAQIEVRTRRGQRKMKPAVVQDDNDHMLGVDKLDQLMSYYSFLHKSVK